MTFWYSLGFWNWSERQDLNLRPLVPQTSALPGCATLRLERSLVPGFVLAVNHRKQIGFFRQLPTQGRAGR